jgi:hypothetical protein
MRVGKAGLGLLALGMLAGMSLRAEGAVQTVMALGKDGKSVEGVCKETALTVRVEGKDRAIPLQKLLSVHRGDAASAYEQERITAGWRRYRARIVRPATVP